MPPWSDMPELVPRGGIQASLRWSWQARLSGGDGEDRAADRSAGCTKLIFASGVSVPDGEMGRNGEKKGLRFQPSMLG